MNGERVLIYGAGPSGAQLATRLLGSDQFLPMAIIDDDPMLRRKMLNGLMIHPPSAIDALIRYTQATCVLLALSDTSRHKRHAAIERLSAFPVRVQIMSEISDRNTGAERTAPSADIDSKNVPDKSSRTA